VSRVLLVGEANPYGGDPEMALYHLPRGASGDRLREILGLRDATYEAIPKANLCPQEWDLREARGRAERLFYGPSDVLVLLGARVRLAFGAPGNEGLFASERRTTLERRGYAGAPIPEAPAAPGEKILVYLPHPSGRNPIWNNPEARARARSLLNGVAPWVPWGEERS
jgi:hypothetical protein